MDSLAVRRENLCLKFAKACVKNENCLICFQEIILINHLINGKEEQRGFLCEEGKN